MSFSARIVLDSLNPASGGHRLTTFMLTYPRFIHSELMTHRVFSRNAASSRAIPYAQMRQAVLTNPAMPMHWGQNQKGMQADGQIGATRVPDAVRIWNEATVTAVHHADKLAEMGVHKQVVNRLLEPFMHITTLVTATEWTNFFALRAHKDAQPEFQFLADLMLQQYVDGTPVSPVPPRAIRERLGVIALVPKPRPSGFRSSVRPRLVRQARESADAGRGRRALQPPSGERPLVAVRTRRLPGGRVPRDGG